MNINRAVPLVLLLLISLSLQVIAYSHAEGSFGTEWEIVQFNVDHANNVINVFAWMNQTTIKRWTGSGSYPMKLESVYNGTFSEYINLYGTIEWTCSGGISGSAICSGSGILAPNISKGVSFVCGGANDNVIDKAFVYGDNDCNTFFNDGIDYVRGGQSDGVTYLGFAIWYPNDLGWHYFVSLTGGGIPRPDWGAGSCWGGNVVADSYSKLYINRDDPKCAVCAQDTVKCASNTTGASLKCYNNAWYSYQSCIQGGWQSCSPPFNSSSECPSVTPSVFTYTTCTDNASCSSNQVCNFGLSSNINGIPNILPYSGSDGFCTNNPGQQCTDDYECTYKFCTNKDSTGVGTCATPCSSDSSCTLSDTCVDPTTLASQSTSPWYTQNPDLSYSFRGIYKEKLCLGSVGTYCSDNDGCYGINCKPQCGSTIDLTGRCTIPTYSCYCTATGDCSSGKACVQQTYTGPVSPSSGTYGRKACMTGKANGQTCSSPSECSSYNCQNGYCCSSGSVCCSSDSQCSSEQVCFTDPDWSAYNRYYTCYDKVAGNGLCQEDKECITPPCSSYFCSGSVTQTTWTYTPIPIDYRTMQRNSLFKVTMNYSTLDGSAVPEPTSCTIRIDNRINITASCTSQFSINLTSRGAHTVSITATKAGYQTAFGDQLTINVVDAGDLLPNGATCTTESDCESGHCQFMVSGQQSGGTISLPCYGQNECSGSLLCMGLSPFYLDNGTTSLPCHFDSECIKNGMPGKCITATVNYCLSPGYCSNPTTEYYMCCANDGYRCCDATTLICINGVCSHYNNTCGNSQYMCNPTTDTCSIKQIPLGQECNMSSQNCMYGICKETYQNASLGVCCYGAGPQNKCCRYTSDCNIALGQICNDNFVCANPQETGIACTDGPTGDSKCIQQYNAPMTCSNGVCVGVTCPSTSDTPCLFCNPSNYTTSYSCANANGTSYINCMDSSLECKLSGGSIGTSPPSVTAGTTTEDLFNNLITLLYYLLIVVIIGFILFVFVAAMHLGYGLIKK
jgi:hypothetical protein